MIGFGSRESGAGVRKIRAYRSEPRFAAGFTLIEVLLVIALIAIVLGIGWLNARRVLQESQERAAVETVRQSIWQGATAASARGRTITLNRVGQSLRLMDGSVVIRTDDLPPSVSTNFQQGVLLEFSPPGKITEASLRAFQDSDPWIGADGKATHLEVSLIGEVRVAGGS